jgi:hypothetical protein
MLELILGAILGTIGSLAIAHLYYRRSSHELEASIASLNSELEALRGLTAELRGTVLLVAGDTAMVRKHAVAGPSDDSDYPYK